LKTPQQKIRSGVTCTPGSYSQWCLSPRPPVVVALATGLTQPIPFFRNKKARQKAGNCYLRRGTFAQAIGAA
tara:strand:- start:294 stop:509 length:216 start_codon:yes stop_codon:yes gene_type:complete